MTASVFPYLQLTPLLVLWVLAPVPEVHAAVPKARLTGVRFLSSANYTRVMLDLTGRVRFTVKSLPASPPKSPRVYLDLSGAGLATSRRGVDVRDRLVQRVRMSQFKPGVVRVVLDLKQTPGNYEAVLLANPHRILVDVERKGGFPVRTKGAAVRRSVRRIVLDPGHGGKDPGAVGVNGIREKDVALGIARMLARRLRREMGVDVVLTRDRDVFVSLKERTNIATRKSADGKYADLFVSIHSNASRNRAAAGLETYHLDRSRDKAILKLAARENGTSLGNVPDLEYILSALKLNLFNCFKELLADNLQSSLVRNVRPRYGQVRDLGVKKGPFYVLTVGEMPAALVELFFVSNRREARALRRPDVRAAIVGGLFQGVKEYADGLRQTRCHETAPG